MNSLPPINALSLQLTDACNLACSYCYFREKEPIGISDCIVSKALDLIESNDDDEGDWHINLFGGEPTLFPRSIVHVAEQATERGCRKGRRVSFSMTTNGTRFDDRMLDISQRYNISTMLSLDGGQTAHDKHRIHHNGRGSFADICDNLDRLKRAPNFKARVTVSVDNVPILFDSIKEIVDLGITRIATSIVAEDSWTEDVFRTFEDQWLKVAALYLHRRMNGVDLSIKGLYEDPVNDLEAVCASSGEFGCGAATTFVFVDAYGDIYPCHRYPGYFNKSDSVKIGNVFRCIDQARRSYFVEANRRTAKKGCGSFLSSSVVQSPSCSRCAIQASCGGSCMAINHNANGDPTKPPSALGRIQRIMLMVAESVASTDLMLAR